MGITARVIQEVSNQTTKLKKSDKSQNREIRAIKDFNINSVTFIYGDKVAIIKLNKSDLMAILISDKTIANDQRQVFEKLWK